MHRTTVASGRPGDRGTRFFGRLAALFFGLILALVLFTSGSMDYACRFAFSANRQLLFTALGLVAMFVLCFGIRILVFYIVSHIGDRERTFRVLVAVGCLVLFAYQMLVVAGGWFKTDWDARALAAVDDPESIRIYLSRYPNQLFLYSVFQAVCGLGRLLGSPDTYLTQIVVGCLCVSLSVFFAVHAARALRGRQVAVVVLVVTSVLVGASPWILVPYSDTYGMLCPSIGLWLYAAHRDRSSAWFGIALSAVLGYAIKPTSVFILAAAFFIEAVRFVGRRLAGRRATVARVAADATGSEGSRGDGSARERRFAGFAVAVIVGAVVASTVTGGVESVQRRQIGIDDDLSFSMSHYLMMGINTDTMGIYNNDDVHRSSDCNSQQERSAMNIRVWKDRLARLWPVGLVHLYHQKLLTAFSDGTFAWSVEGEFWIEMHGDIAPIKAYYGIGNFNRVDPNGQNGMWFLVVSQTLWLGCLLGIVLLGVSDKLDAQTVAPMLAISALALFLMVFETRARYLFLFAPYFCVLGVAGWSDLVDRVAAWLATLAHEDAEERKFQKSC